METSLITRVYVTASRTISLHLQNPINVLNL